MAGLSFHFEGLEELQRDIGKCVSRYPDQTEKELFRLAGVFTKDVNAKMPGSYASGKRPIPSEWHRTRDSGFGGGGFSVGVEIRNSAPHWHLVENGHVLKGDPAMYAAKMGGKLDSSKGHRQAKSRSKNANLRTLGFVPGRHYCENTRQEWNGKFPGYMATYVDKMLKGHNL